MVEVWNESDSDIENDDIDIMQANESPDIDITGVVRIYILFLFLWQRLFSVSNAGIELLLNFMAKYLSLLARVLRFNRLVDISSKFPTSLYQAKKCIQSTQDTFKKYCSCSCCHALYEIGECIIMVNGKKESALCSFQKFPNHSMPSMRKACGNLLMKTIRSCKDTIFLYPRQVYCYTSPIDMLRTFLKRPGFFQLCQEWKDRNQREDVIADVYDGAIWHHFEQNDFLKMGTISVFCSIVIGFNHLNIAHIRLVQFILQYKTYQGI